jgi:peroxiredoxin Q/BCP
MKLPIPALALFWLSSVPAFAALQPGDVAPQFRAQAALAGKEFTYSLADSLRKGAVVVYFYPSAYTQGCNLQAHTFSEQIDEFSAAGASVIGVSLDDIARLKDFSADPQYCAGKLAVASDADGAIAGAFKLKVDAAVAGAKDSRGIEIGHAFAERTTFIVTPDGEIAATIGGVTPFENVKQALEAVRKLKPLAHLKSSRDLAAEAQANVEFVSQATLKQRIAANPRLVLLDVRTKEEYDGGHLKGASWVERGIAEFMLVRQLPDPDAEIVVYCKVGNRTGLVVKSLRSAGYRNVVGLEGGFDAWASEGNAVHNYLGEFRLVALNHLDSSTPVISFYEDKTLSP